MVAFQQALMNEWGDTGVAEVETALESTGRLSQVQSSAMFFLAQEAGAVRASLHVLGSLFSEERDDWNASEFAEPRLLEVSTEVLTKFLASEESDGHLIDPNVWRNAAESGGKVAIYCTSFATVVVDILQLVKSLSPDRFAKLKNEFFPVMCRLVQSQSEEIRRLVHDVLIIQIAPLLQVTA